MKILVLITGLLTLSSSTLAAELVTINTSKSPLYQAIIEPVRFSNGQAQKRTFVINMDDSATFKLGDDSAESSTITVMRSEIPSKDFTVFLNASVSFASDETMGLNQSDQTLSSRLPLSDGERIMLGGNQVSTEQNDVTNEAVTEIWFTLNQQQ